MVDTTLSLDDDIGDVDRFPMNTCQDTRLENAESLSARTAVAAPAVLLRFPRSGICDLIDLPEYKNHTFHGWYDWSVDVVTGSLQLSAVTLPSLADVPKGEDVIQWARSWRERMPGWDAYSAADFDIEYDAALTNSTS
jgi:hypothetical protein